MEIRVEADFEIDMSLLMNNLSSKLKDRSLSISRHGDSANLTSYYYKYRDGKQGSYDGIELSINYYDNWKRVRNSFVFFSSRYIEGDTPVVFSEEYPLFIAFTPKSGVKAEPHEYFFTPETVDRYSNGTIHTMISFSWDSVKYIANWVLYDVVIKYYEKDGTLKELPIPEDILKQWREMIVSPKALVEKN